MSLCAALLAIPGIVAAVACSSSSGSGSTAPDDDAGTTNPPVTISADTETDFQASYCALLASCCATIPGASMTQPFCAKSYADIPGAELANWRGTYDSKAGAACLAAIQKVASHAPNWCVALGNNQLPATVIPPDAVYGCTAVYTGGAPPGSACSKDTDCAEPPGERVFCANSKVPGPGVPSGTGTCAVLRRGSAGDGPCLAAGFLTDPPRGIDAGADDAGIPTSYSCYLEDGVYCDGTSRSCTPLLQQGQRCGSTSECAANLYCFSSTCQPRGAVGVACLDLNACVDGAYCDGTTRKCAALISIGGACDDPYACVGSRDGNASCYNGVCATGAPFPGEQGNLQSQACHAL